jgi:hypothetical protein
MNKEVIKEELIGKHKSFTDYINSMSENESMTPKNKDKWSAVQQLKHIYLSIRPVSIALRLPRLLIRLIFGKPKHTRTYEEIVTAYQLALKNGGKAGAAYIPKSVSSRHKLQLIDDVTRLIKSIVETLDQLSEEDLDNYVLPHPLIGKTTFREMLYFTIYHVQHHQRTIIEN